MQRHQGNVQKSLTCWVVVARSQGPYWEHQTLPQPPYLKDLPLQVEYILLTSVACVMSSRERNVFPSPVRISTSSLGWTSFNNWNEDYVNGSHYCNVSDCSCFCQHSGISIFFNYLWKSKLVRIIERFEKSGVKLLCWLVKGSWFGSNYREFRKTAVSKNGVFTVMHYYKPLDKCLLLKMQ